MLLRVTEHVPEVALRGAWCRDRLKERQHQPHERRPRPWGFHECHGVVHQTPSALGFDPVFLISDASGGATTGVARALQRRAWGRRERLLHDVWRAVIPFLALRRVHE